jgi:APA family basic amino acid/polyamine antiporter
MKFHTGGGPRCFEERSPATVDFAIASRDGTPREIGFWSASALVVGHTIGVGIFLTPAELIGALASPALTLGLWLACGGLVLAGALTFGELASRYPEAGGLYVYLREAWGPRVAFLYGWQSLLIMDPGVTAALAIGVTPYAVVLFPSAVGHERAMAVAAVWTLAFVDMAGLRLSSRSLNALTALKLLALVGVIAGAFTVPSGSWEHFRRPFSRAPGSPPLTEALGVALIGAFYSFGGFWEASRVAGEMREPRRLLPRALTLGVVAVTAAYLAITAAFLYAAPASSSSSVPVVAFGGSLLRASAAAVVLSVAASILALLLMAPRLYLAMSADGLFPAALAATHPRTGAPLRATALLAAIASLFVMTGSFSQIVALFLCTTLVFIGLAAAGLFVVRGGPRAPAGEFRAPGYPLTPALFVLLVFAVVLLIALARPLPALAGFALMLIGLPVYRVLSKRERTSGSASRELAE